MGFFEGMTVSEAKTPRIQPGLYPALEVVRCKVFQGDATQGGLRYIVEFRVADEPKPVDTTGFESFTGQSTPPGGLASWSTRLDDSYGYGRKDVATFLSVALGSDLPNDIVKAASESIEEHQPLAGRIVSAHVLPAKARNGNEFCKVFWSAVMATSQKKETAPVSAAPPPPPVAAKETKDLDSVFLENGYAPNTNDETGTWYYSVTDASDQKTKAELTKLFG